MTSDRWQRFKAAVGVALGREPDSREESRGKVRALPQSGERTRELEALLKTASHFPGTSPISPRAGIEEDAESPRSIGPYVLERELGSGGMGQVWLAEQIEPLHRRVALKLIRAEFHDPETKRRFLAERQSLALMNHPAIAKVFDAGATPAGQPYLAMEYVDGCPLTEYCDQHQLPITERLRLFQLVCEGVQHAHQKAILHRDLKPSNILVTEVDGKPQPRIIDFGLAKTVTPDLDDVRMFTQPGLVLGTFGYMSPEQAEGSSEDVDTRSDVYALGVLLYELLTGELPLARKPTYYEMLRQLHEEDAPRPSTKVRASESSKWIAQNRGTETNTLSRQLRGDGDSILLKSVERDRDRRYATPAELSADIERWLRDEPVLAHAASSGYLARKYIRRHLVAVSVTTGTVLLLVGFASVQTLQLRNTRRQRDRADRITDFMTNIFRVSDPSESRGSKITVREILDQSSHQIETGEGFDPVVRLQLMEVMAKTYAGLGLYGRAHDLAQRTLDGRRQTFGPNDPRTLKSMTQLADLLDRQGHVDEAEALMQKTIELDTRVVGRDDPLTLETKNDLAAIFNQHAHYMGAEKLDREVIPIETRTLGSANLLTLSSENNLASALRGQSRFAEAETVFRQTLQEERQTLGSDHPYVLATMHNLANMLSEEDRIDEAEKVYRETLAIERRVLGPEHPETASTMTTLANTLSRSTGRGAEAEQIYREALAIDLRTVGPDHAYTTQAEEGLANDLVGQHRLPEARTLLEEVQATRQRTLGPDNTDTILTSFNLAHVLYRENHLAKAEQLMRETLAKQIRVLDPNDPDIPASKAELAQILLKENRLEAAEDFARQAFDTQSHLLGPQHEDTRISLMCLAESLAKLDRYREAQVLFEDTIAKISTVSKEKLPDAWYDFAELAAAAGHRDDAFLYLDRAVEAGFHDVESMRSDEELSSLRNDSRFQQALASAQEKLNR